MRVGCRAGAFRRGFAGIVAQAQQKACKKRAEAEGGEAAPVVETAAPAAEAVSPAVETVAPAAEAVSPVVETVAPAAETSTPAAGRGPEQQNHNM